MSRYRNLDLACDLSKAYLLERAIGVERAQSFGRYSAEVLEDPDDIAAARLLATAEFVRLGKIDASMVGPDGILYVDRFFESSVFFGVKDKKSEDEEIVATGRLIIPDHETAQAGLRLPMELLPEESVARIMSYEPGTFGEFGALAKARGTRQIATMYLIRKMLAYSMENGISKWVCGLEPKIYPEFKRRFLGALTELSEEDIPFPGIQGDQTALELDIEVAHHNYVRDMTQRRLGAQALNRVIVNFIMNEVPYLDRPEAIFSEESL